MAISGAEFKKKYPNTEFYKLTNETECHNEFQFKDGLNVDIVSFNPKGECSKGGLYFTELYKIGMWTNYIEIKYIRKVEILDDSLVYIENNKFKTDKFFLHEKALLENFPYWNDEYFCKVAVTQDGLVLQYVKEQTEEICKLAVQENGLALQYVQEQTEDICRLAVRQNHMATRYFKNDKNCLTLYEYLLFLFGY